MLETIPRETIYLAQTPQAFRRDVLRDALALAETGVEVTDEATLAERAGHAVRLVQGEPSNIKITTAGRSARSPKCWPAAAATAAPDASRGNGLRSAPAGRRPAADARRRDDSVRARAARTFRRRRHLPCRDRRAARRRRPPATSAVTFPTPTRSGRAPRASTCCAARRRSSAAAASPSSTWTSSSSPSARSSAAMSMRCARNLARCPWDPCGGREHQGQDERRRRRARTRRSDCRPRRRAAQAIVSQ